MVNIWLLLGLTAAMVSLKLNSLDGAQSGKSVNVAHWKKKWVLSRKAK